MPILRWINLKSSMASSVILNGFEFFYRQPLKREKTILEKRRGKLEKIKFANIDFDKELALEEEDEEIGEENIKESQD